MPPRARFPRQVYACVYKTNLGKQIGVPLLFKNGPTMVTSRPMARSVPMLDDRKRRGNLLQYSTSTASTESSFSLQAQRVGVSRCIPAQPTADRVADHLNHIFRAVGVARVNGFMQGSGPLSHAIRQAPASLFCTKASTPPPPKSVVAKLRQRLAVFPAL